MKLCEYHELSCEGIPMYCGRPATRSFDFAPDGVYRPVCETHFQSLKKARKEKKR